MIVYVVCCFGVTLESEYGVIFFYTPGGFVACVVLLLPVDRLGGPERSFSFS